MGSPGCLYVLLSFPHSYRATEDGSGSRARGYSAAEGFAGEVIGLSDELEEELDWLWGWGCLCRV